MPRDLETVCLKCLRKEPAGRYGSAEALADDLRRFHCGEPIRARRTGLAGVAWRWCRRHKAVAGLLGVVAALLLTITASSVISARRYRTIAGEANAARAEADRSASEAKAVIGFVVNDVLAAASPTRTRGEPLSILQALANADQAVSTRFAGEPLVEAAVRQALAETYFELGEYARAEGHAERALVLRERHQGPEHESTLRAMNTLGRVGYRLDQKVARTSRLQRAESLFRRVLEVYRRTRRDDDLTCDAMCGLADIEHYRFASVWSASGASRDPVSAASRVGEALALRERVLASRRERLGSSDPRTLAATTDLAMTLDDLGRLAEAEALLREAAETGSREAPDADQTLANLNRYANLLSRLGRADEAAAWADRSVEAQLRVFKFKHPDTLYAITLACITKVAAHGEGEALRFVDRALAQARSELGPDDLAIYFILLLRSELLYRRGDLEGARAGFQAVAELRPPTEDNLRLLCSWSALMKLAVVRRDQGAIGEAKNLLARFRENLRFLDRDRDRLPPPAIERQFRRKLAFAEVLTRNMGRPERSQIAPGAPGGPPRIDAPLLAESPILDGRIGPGEYGDGDGYPFDFTGDDNPGRSFIMDGMTPTSKEPSDLSARLFAAHTASALFVAVRVRDQYLRVDPVARGRPEFNDAVEVFLDGDRVANDFSTVSGLDILAMCTGNREGFELIADASGNRHYSAQGVGKTRWKVGTSRTENGYVVEFEIPLDLIDTQDGPGFRPASTGSELRMNVAIIDQDETVNKQQTFYGMLWSEERVCSPGLEGEDVWPVALRLTPAPLRGH
jgi:tetratricopeptide (TPR) repeat protein